MATRRMFSKTITNSSEFLMMSQSAQNLYFHFGMNADDDGFCEVFTIMRMTDSKPDDLQSLHSRNFIFLVDNKVCIVKDWHENNQLRLDRYKKSAYLDNPKYAEIYNTVMEDKIKTLEIYKKKLIGLPNGNQMATQDRLGKDRLGKIRIDTNKSQLVSEFEELWKIYPSSRRVDKQKCKDRFIKLSEQERSLALQRIKEHVSSQEWIKENGRFIPLSSTWFNQCRWEQELTANIKPQIKTYE